MRRLRGPWAAQRRGGDSADPAWWSTSDLCGERHAETSPPRAVFCAMALTLALGISRRSLQLLRDRAIALAPSRHGGVRPAHPGARGSSSASSASGDRPRGPAARGRGRDRYVSGRRDRLASGVALPFAMALHEYDVAPQQLALTSPEGRWTSRWRGSCSSRRNGADAERPDPAARGGDRADRCQLTARGELMGLLGAQQPPWTAPRSWNRAHSTPRPRRPSWFAGADLVRVEVPVGRDDAPRRAGEFDQDAVPLSSLGDDELIPPRPAAIEAWPPPLP